MPEECIHYWHIDSEDKGTCKKCGAIRDFRALLARERNAEFLDFYKPVKRVKLAEVKLKEGIKTLG